MRDCSVSTAGAQALADVLPQNKRLKVLKLDENNLGIEGALALADGIRESPLEELFVSGTSISDEGTGHWIISDLQHCFL